jgi:site-specific recombinase XerD
MRDGAVRARNGGLFKPSVTRKYEAMLRLFVVPRIGAVSLGSLQKRDVQRLVDELASVESAETARKALTALRVVFRMAERDGVVDASPCVGVRAPTDPDADPTSRIVTPEEARATIEAAERDDARLGRSLGGPLFGLAFGTGLRGNMRVCTAGVPEGDSARPTRVS